MELFEEVFHIEYKGEKDVHIHFIEPIIDVDAANLLKKTLNRLAEENRRNIVLDFQHVEVLGSSGIGKILLFNKRLKEEGGHLKLIGLNEELVKLFKYLRLNLLIDMNE